MRRYNKVTEHQKSVIKFLASKGMSPDEIAKEDELCRKDGSKIDVRTVQRWLTRQQQTDQMKEVKKSGRKRKLNGREEQNLVNYIKKHTKLVYRRVRSKCKLLDRCSVRTVNRYAQRNNIRKWLAI